MSNFVISPNMSLPIPTPGQDPGPDYASNLQSSLQIVDGHNHSPGSGVLINTNGLNINADLPINGNNLTLVKTVNFQSLSVPLPGSPPNLGCVYVAGNELYYNDESGNVVQITNGGSVNAGAGSITGLPSGTASASYSSGPGTFVWQSATNTAANMDNASVTIREQASGANGITISSPSSLAANYSLKLLPALPPSIRFLAVDNAGNMSTPAYIDNVTIDIASNNLEVKPGSIGFTQLQARPVGTPAPVGGLALSASSGAYFDNSNATNQITNMSVTITTTGRPVFIGFTSDGSNNRSFIGVASTAGAADMVVELWEGPVNTGTQLSVQDIAGEATGSTIENFVPIASVSFLITPPAGTHTYNLASRTFGSTDGFFQYALMYAYEL